MLAKVMSSAVIGIDAFEIEVEVDISNGLPAFTIVGLPETAVRESKERVKAAIRNAGYRFPDDRITVNLAPAHIKKEGTGYDLPIALGILCACGVFKNAMLDGLVFWGELSLDARIKPVAGTLPMAFAARKAGREAVVVPQENRREAAIVSGVDVYAVHDLSQVVSFLDKTISLDPVRCDPDGLLNDRGPVREDFADVKGQEHVKRALEIAAAGGHNLLMIGPPGAGKTMLARRLSTILPPPTLEEAIETTKIHSVAGLLEPGEALVAQRSFRSPHHTISDAGLIGGGAMPKPGEVSLAHNGVLFLDELPEYKKHVLEVMRQPLEDGRVTISRASTSITFPANFMLVAAMNPCPCGYYTDPRHACSCTASQIQRYKAKLSGPLLDRIDMNVHVPAVAVQDLSVASDSESSQCIRERVLRARYRQARRFKQSRLYCNAQMSSRHLREHCALNSASVRMLDAVVDKFSLSARAYYRVLKLARTIADLDGEASIGIDHLSEAVGYRSTDNSNSVHDQISD